MKSLEEIHPYISIHALLAESDQLNAHALSGHFHFYPRSPYGERPGPKSRTPDKYYFYPRSPYGERHCQKMPKTGQY